MRIISLLKIAAEAEVLRLRATAERQGRRAALGAIALVFALGVLVSPKSPVGRCCACMWHRLRQRLFCSVPT